MTVMRDLSYREALELAEQRYKACVDQHDLQRIPLSTLINCRCGWYGKSIEQWAGHVEKECGPGG